MHYEVVSSRRWSLLMVILNYIQSYATYTVYPHRLDFSHRTASYRNPCIYYCCDALSKYI